MKTISGEDYVKLIGVIGQDQIQKFNTLRSKDTVRSKNRMVPQVTLFDADVGMLDAKNEDKGMRQSRQ